MQHLPRLTTAQPFEHLARGAQRHPDRPALISVDRQLTYLELTTQAARLASVLRARGMKSGDVVAVCVANDLQVVFGAALWVLATVGCGTTPEALSTTSIPYQWVIAYHSVPGFDDTRTIIVDEALFFEAASVTEDVEVASYDSLDAPCRLVTSSGTTGIPLPFPQTIAGTQRETEGYLSAWTEGHQPFMSLLGFGAGLGLCDSWGSFASGGTYLCPGDAAESATVIATQFVSGIIGSPVQLASLLEATNETPQQLESLIAIFSAGAVMAPALHQALVERTGATIYSAYGTTENGAVARSLFPADGVVTRFDWICDGVELEIRDDEGNDLAPGTIGQLCIRNPRMPEDYLFASSRSSGFRNGWFHSGDLASLDESGGLSLHGRSSEIINIGGVKFDPTLVDHAVSRLEAIEDAAAFEGTGPEGIPRIVVAIVTRGTPDLAAIVRAVAAVVPGVDNPSAFVCAQIPRTPTGKIQRHVLAERYLEALRPT